MERTKCTSLNIHVDKLLLEASLIHESAHTSNSEEQHSMNPTQKCHFAKPVAFEYLKKKVKNSVPIKSWQQADWSAGLWME